MTFELVRQKQHIFIIKNIETKKKKNSFITFSYKNHGIVHMTKFVLLTIINDLPYIIIIE